MAESIEITEWHLYNGGLHGREGGNYLFLFKTFDCAPYYSGEANDFEDRLFRGHQSLFQSGGRTFMRASFSQVEVERSHTAFARRWMDYKNQPTREAAEALVWVPNRTCPENIRYEGSHFWSDEVAILIFPNKYEAAKRRLIESRIQLDMMQYYERLVGHSIDWTLPERSRLVGKGGEAPSFAVAYRLNGGVDMEPGAFFNALRCPPICASRE